MDAMDSLDTLDHANSSELDLAGQEFKSNHRAHLLDWATRPPFYIFNQGPAQVVVGRYADVREVFEDAERFSSALPEGPGYEQYDKFMGARFVTQMDGDQHGRLRRLLMPAFSARRLEQMRDSVTEIIEDLLDKIEAGPREFDAMGQYAAQLVIGVLMTAMFNLDAAQRQVLLEFQRVQPVITTLRPGEPYTPEVTRAHRDAVELAECVIAERRARPRSDFLGDLVDARDSGDRLTDKELFDQIFGVFGAVATTPRSASGALHLIYGHPGQSRRLRADPALVPAALEECLRLAGNGYFTFPRFATRDTEVGGVPIPKGMVVRASPMAANLDPLAFPDPLRFDIDRNPRRIMTFGAGPHHCVGNLLGRMALTVAISGMLRRFPEARLADVDFKPEYGGAAGELRMKSLPMLRF